MSPWRDYPSSGPIAVEGGIKAKSKRGAIGEQWWSQRFIAVLDSYGHEQPAAAGPLYARRGQVIEFALEPGMVAAHVQGSRPEPYLVTIKVRPLTSAQWRAVESAAGRPGAVPGQAAGGRDAAGDRASLRRLRHAAVPPVGSRPDDGLQLPGLGGPVQAPGGGLLRARRGVRRRPVRDARPGAARSATTCWPRCAARPEPPLSPPPAGAHPPAAQTSPAQALLADVTGVPPAESLADFWSPG